MITAIWDYDLGVYVWPTVSVRAQVRELKRVRAAGARARYARARWTF
jgi:hypothetical protein